jgi:dipeptidyl aminopeptidase/acylaminoacyl peptidase
MNSPFDLNHFLNIRSASGATFSPDGRFVVFRSDMTGIGQLWQVPVAGGWPVQLTFAAESVHGGHCSPIRHEIVYALDAGGNERDQLFLLHGIAGGDHGLGDGWDSVDLTRSPAAIHHFGGWSPDGERIAFAANRTDRSRFDVYLQKRTDRVARRLATGPGGYFYLCGWSPDGRTLLAQHDLSSANQDLYLIDAVSGKKTLLTAHEGNVEHDEPYWSADGKFIWCLSTRGGRDLIAPARIDVATGKLTYAIESRDFEVDGVRPSSKGRWLAYTLNAGGKSLLFLRDLATGKSIPAPDLPVGVVSGLRFAPDDGALAFTFQGPRHNADLWLWDLAGARGKPQVGKQLRRLTQSGRAGIPFSRLVEPELVEYPTFDGRRIPAWYFPPAKKPQGLPPVIVYPHGGPESQTRPHFDPIFQFFCQHGYAVFAPNVRGSTGYGHAYMNLDNITRREDAILDLAYAACWIRGKKRGDPRRMAVYGWSYGGFMVLAAVTRFPELWAAGIDVVGVCNFETFLEKTGEYRRAHREAEYGNLREHRAFLRKISPIHQADRIRCPMMVIHGANDPRVPIGEAEQIVAALKKRKVPIEYLRYEDEGHGLENLKNQLDAYPKMVAFLDRHVKNRSPG